MDIETYLFTGDRNCTTKLEGKSPVGIFSGIQVNGLDPTTLTSLESILSGIDPFEINRLEGAPHIIWGNGPWLVVMPLSFLNEFKKLNGEARLEALQLWCQSEEMVLYKWTPDKASYILDWLIDASHKCKKNDYLFLYMSHKSCNYDT